MNVKNKDTIREMIKSLQSNIDSLESLIKSENDRLEKMDNRQRALDNKEDIIIRDTACMDIARLSITDAIEDLSKVLETIS